MPRIQHANRQRWDHHTRQYLTYRDGSLRLTHTNIPKAKKRPRKVTRMGLMRAHAPPVPASDSGSSME